MKDQDKLDYKRDLILNSMELLLQEPESQNASIAQIAIKAGVGKGSIYYYFQSRDEILDALIDRVYADSIAKCEEIISNINLDALSKFQVFLEINVAALTEEPSPIIKFTYREDNVLLQQKSKQRNMTKLVPLLAAIIRQGIFEKNFKCAEPEALAMYFIVLIGTCFTTLLTHENQEQCLSQIIALEAIIQSSLQAPKDSMLFIRKTLSIDKFLSS